MKIPTTESIEYKVSELLQMSSLSTFHQVMLVYVRKFKVNPLHNHSSWQ